MTEAGAPPDPTPPAPDGPVPPTPPAGPAMTLDNPRRELVVGGAIIVLFFVIFLGWAALAPLDAGAYAQGQIARPCSIARAGL
jgi:HlyD family secretion protein